MKIDVTKLRAAIDETSVDGLVAFALDLGLKSEMEAARKELVARIKMWQACPPPFPETLT